MQRSRAISISISRMCSSAMIFTFAMIFTVIRPAAELIYGNATPGGVPRARPHDRAVMRSGHHVRVSKSIIERDSPPFSTREAPSALYQFLRRWQPDSSDLFRERLEVFLIPSRI